MKIAAAEALWNTCDSHCSFSLFQIGGGKNDKTPTQILEVPDLLVDPGHQPRGRRGAGHEPAPGPVHQGVRPGELRPQRFIQYWSMRVMAYLGSLVFAFALWGAWLLRRKKLEAPSGSCASPPGSSSAPFLMNTAGWLLTESGRQPWIVQGLMKTARGPRPT